MRERERGGRWQEARITRAGTAWHRRRPVHEQELDEEELT